MTSAAHLDAVYEGIRSDPFWNHLRAPGIRLVPGLGNGVDPYVFVVGEAPGAVENTTGKPFTGAAGRALAGLMSAAGIGPHDACFVTNVLKYRPPGNRTPTPEEITHATFALREEYREIGAPPVIVTVGGTAKVAILAGQDQETRRKVGSAAGRPAALPGGVTLWPMYHPAAGLRSPRLRPIMETHWEELGKWIHANVTR